MMTWRSLSVCATQIVRRSVAYPRRFGSSHRMDYVTPVTVRPPPTHES